MTLCAGYPQNSQPLSEGEKRQILLQLNELRSCRQTVLGYEEFLAREKEQDERERANMSRALELEKQATGLAQRETAIQKERADFYEAVFKSVTKGSSFGCVVKKILTLGIARCR